MMHWGGLGSIGYGGFGPGLIIMIVFWMCVIFGVVYLIKWLAGDGKTTVSRETAEDILRKRYASGEITKDEYLKTMSAIMR